MPRPETINRLLELGATLAQPVHEDPEGKPYAIVPAGCTVHNLENYYAPKRIHQCVVLDDSASFCAYVNRFKNSDTQIFADVTPTNTILLAVLDYHGGGPKFLPAHTAHRVEFVTERTGDSIAWQLADRKHMAQLEFAQWLEEYGYLLIQPKGAELLELVASLHGHSEARFNQTFRLEDGAARLAFDEDVTIRGTTGTSSKPGELELPGFLTAQFAFFEGDLDHKVAARLKVRLDNRKLALWFETIGWDKLYRTAVADLLAEVAAETELPILRGTLG
jgi:uncharacterized protein YfdQ (DUF2303 family)